MTLTVQCGAPKKTTNCQMAQPPKHIYLFCLVWLRTEVYLYCASLVPVFAMWWSWTITMWRLSSLVYFIIILIVILIMLITNMYGRTRITFGDTGKNKIQVTSSDIKQQGNERPIIIKRINDSPPLSRDNQELFHQIILIVNICTSHCCHHHQIAFCNI